MSTQWTIKCGRAQSEAVPCAMADGINALDPNNECVGCGVQMVKEPSWEMRTCDLLQQYFGEIFKQRDRVWREEGMKQLRNEFRGQELEDEIEAVLQHWAQSIPGVAVYGQGPYGEV